MKNIARSLAAITLGFAGLLNANAAEEEEWDYSRPYADECYRTGGAQTGYNACIAKELQKQDSELNVLYGKLISELVEAKELRVAQRAWLNYRDHECKLRTSGMAELGTGVPFALDSCKLDLTLKRIKDLKYLRDTSGCNGCPVLKRDVH